MIPHNGWWANFWRRIDQRTDFVEDLSPTMHCGFPSVPGGGPGRPGEREGRDSRRPLHAPQGATRPGANPLYSREHPIDVRRAEHPQSRHQQIKAVGAQLQQLVLDRDRQPTLRDRGRTDPANHVLNLRDPGIDRLAKLLGHPNTSSTLVKAESNAPGTAMTPIRTSVTLPGQPRDARRGPDRIEIGPRG
jgi:hypothetical protein